MRYSESKKKWRQRSGLAFFPASGDRCRRGRMPTTTTTTLNELESKVEGLERKLSTLAESVKGEGAETRSRIAALMSSVEGVQRQLRPVDSLRELTERLLDNAPHGQSSRTGRRKASTLLKDRKEESSSARDYTQKQLKLHARELYEGWVTDSGSFDFTHSGASSPSDLTHAHSLYLEIYQGQATMPEASRASPRR